MPPEERPAPLPLPTPAAGPASESLGALVTTALPVFRPQASGSQERSALRQGGHSE